MGELVLAKARQDIWSRWLLDRRFGGDPKRMLRALEILYPVREKVLSHARLGAGDTLLGVG